MTKLQNKLNSLQAQLSERTNRVLSSDSVQRICQEYKVQQMGLKSQYDKKKDDLQQDNGIKDIMLNKIISKNKLLILEKNRHMKLLKRKGKVDKSFDYKNLIDIMHQS